MTARTVLTDLVDQAFEKNEFPEAAREKAAICLADFLSCAIEAADLPSNHHRLAELSGIEPAAEPRSEGERRQTMICPLLRPPIR